MKRTHKVIYAFDDNDPFAYPKQIDEAFNLLANFCPELYEPKSARKEDRHSALRALNVITAGGNGRSSEFERKDVNMLRDYADLVIARAKEKIAAGKVLPAYVPSIEQAIDRLKVVMGNVAQAVDQADEEAV